MKPDDRIRLMHMAESLGHAIRFIKGHNRADLDIDQMLTFALLSSLQTVGEAPTTPARKRATRVERR